MRLVIAAALLFSTVSASAEQLAPPPTPEEDVLALVNAHRAHSGLPAVTLDATASAGCKEHARYMLLNKDSDAMVGLNAHTQDPKLPGASPAGAACGKAADLFPGVSDLATAVDGFMAGLYHRRPIISPDLEKIGVGYAALPNGTLMAAVMFVNAKKAKPGWPVAYPGADQRDVPLEFGNEIPNPIPNGARLGGYPITFQFPPFDKVSNVTFDLRDAANKPVAIHLSTPEAPATSFGQYGVICAIPKALLVAGAKYTARVTATWTPKFGVGGQPPQAQKVDRSWSFTTVGLVQVDAADEAALLGALGKPSLVRGKVKWGGMMDAATAFLSFEIGKAKRYELVSVIIPVKLWQQLAPSAEPKTWIGRSLEVEAAPHLVQGKYLNLSIVQASQIRVAK